MNAFLLFLVSLGCKIWYEKLREQNMPEIMLHNIDTASAIRVNFNKK